MLIRSGLLALRRASKISSPRVVLLSRGFNTTRCLARADVFPSQLQDPSAAAILSSLKRSHIPQTLTEKIFQRHSVGLKEDQYVKSGDFVSLAPAYTMTHDNSWPTALKFMSIGASKIHDPSRIVMTLDHDVQNKSESNLKKYRQIEEFAKKQGVDFYGAGRGIGHQIMVEEGYAFPGTLAVASDSHSNMYGGIGCLGTPIVRTDAASIWATGRTWFQIPRIARLKFTGVLPRGVTGKDIIVALCGLFSKDEVLNHAIEFTGSEETMRSLPVDARLTIANMTTEWGGLSGLFPIDGVLEKWLRYKATDAAMSNEFSNSLTPKRFSHQRVDDLFSNAISADKDANYAKYLYMNLSTLSPYVSGPNSVKLSTPLEELAAQNIKIHKAYLVSCTNSRASDLAAAAKVFKDAVKETGGSVHIAEGVSFYIAAASMPEQLAAEEAGDWQAMLDAGAKALPSGCGPCIGLGTGLLESGEVGISASNRKAHLLLASSNLPILECSLRIGNFKGRMGSTEAKAYLASPEVVASSALSGTISGPGSYKRPEGLTGVSIGEGHGSIGEGSQLMTAQEALERVIGQLESHIVTAEKEILPEEVPSAEEALVPILPGFPERVEGELLLLDADNINTDAIYPGKYTYQDHVTSEEMAQVCMSNYDPYFAEVACPGDILVGGFNFGCGSSREQAATCILAKGIPLVIAGSFGSIFQRNSINNALNVLELPKLVQRLRETFSNTSLRASQQDVREPDMNRESLDSPPPAPQVTPVQEKKLTRRTGWHFTWDVARSQVTIREADGQTWSQRVGALPPNVQEIIARGGLEKWVKKEIEAGS